MSNNSTSPLRQRMIDDMTARQLSEGTQTAHLRSCKRFAMFLGRSPETTTCEDVRQFQLHLAETDIGICTRNVIMSGIKFLFRVTLRRLDLVEEIYYISEPQNLPLTMSQTEVQRLLLMAKPLKARVMLSLAFGCGLRAGEVVRLKVGDIDSSQNIIRIVQAKERKDRHVMLSKDLLGLLRLWWKVRSKRLDADMIPEQRWLFPGRQTHLTTRQFNRLFHNTLAAAGITKPVTLHSLRHSFATHLLEQDVDIRHIQALLGHNKLDTTDRYTRVATGRIAAIESPLDILSKAGKKRKKKQAR